MISFAAPEQLGDQADVWPIPNRRCGVRVKPSHLSQTVAAAPDSELPNMVRDLVLDVLLPHCNQTQTHDYFEIALEDDPFAALAAAAQRGEAAEAQDDKLPELHPFVTGAAKTLAGWYRRSPQSEGWVLPHDVPKVALWVAAALAHWAVTYRSFPLVGGWWEQDHWRTAPEVEASRNLASLKVELSDTNARLLRAIDEAKEYADRASADALTGARRLLTEKGTPLAQAVHAALVELGYQVVEVDALEQLVDAGGKAEDYRIVDPDDPSTDPLIEVKGYDKGAKAGDLTNSFVTRLGPSRRAVRRRPCGGS